jgi:DNA polymerase kappa
MSQLSGEIDDQEWLEEGEDDELIGDGHDGDDDGGCFAHDVVATIATRAIVPAATASTTPIISSSSSSTSTLTSSSTSSFKPLSRMRLNTDKAGMEGLDTAKINQVIEEASRGSRFSQHQERKQRDNERVIAEMLARLARATPAELRQAERDADAMLARMESQAAAVLDRVFIHIDMDAFYASVEARDDPRLNSVPFAVGSSYMLMTSNYLARRWGVRAGMPGFIGKKLCPHLEFVPHHFDKYKAASRAVREILTQYDPHLMAYSLDEALCDVTDWLRGNPDVTPAALAERIHEQVLERTQLTCSIGIGSNSGVAKIGANVRKPNGTFQVASDRKSVIEFVQALTVNKVPGIGRVLQAQLAALGIATVGDIFARRASVVLLFTPAAKAFVLESSIGAFSTRPTSERHAPRKSMSIERTTKALSDPDELLSFLRSVCEKLASDLIEKDLRGHSLTVKAKSVSFLVRSRAARVDPPIGGDDIERLYACAKELLVPLMPISIRLLGVRVAAFVGQEGEAGAEETEADQPRIDAFFSSRKRSQPDIDAMTTTTVTTSSKASVSQPQLCDAPVEAFHCPMCSVDLSGRRAVEASIHVDRCLAGTSDTSKGSAKVAPSSPAKRMPKSNGNGSSTKSTIDRFFKK